ncbi:MAG: branched-chain amino acid ABC transporter permease [Alphaproteobacteria bacterium]|jgi:branched-chain amino acid transport system permease protein|nr:branched-chain amino acid ABC transporter permease [Rhodospirillaceae bacterium]MDP6407201.1 branched-chain amino acid ABC transporter permease [Alphaproteobacteria bacterium]MDP6621805.1 branched-chain amino acid ABC transporter permease [Alphaproteobacteria bacterium]
MLTDLIQALIATLSVGAMYALVAVGVALVYNATNIINFAQGEFVMLGGMIMVSLYGDLNWPIYAAIPATLALTMLVGLALMRVSFRPGSNTSLISVLIITIGASLFISGTAQHIWDADIHRFQPFSGDDPIPFLGAAIAPQSLWIVGIAIIVVGGLTAFFQFSIYGKAMKACAVDRRAAELLGIGALNMVRLSFVMSAALGCVAGIIMTPLTMIDYAGGMMLAIKGFSAAMLGGMGNIVGAVIGGLLFALLESLAATYFSNAVKELITFIVIINVLLFMPRGIMGARRVEGFDEEEVLGD